jgi:phage N-6-adenine-methyltransferase
MSKCETCRRKFKARRTDAKTCSDACRQMLRRRRLGVTVRRRYKRDFQRRVSAPDCVHFSSQTDLWSTPPDLFDALDREFNFALDVCATAENAKCERFYSPSDDGLAQHWQGTCWMNPPYGRAIAAWMAKARDASRDGATVVALVPVRTDTRWWRDNVTGATEIRFLPGRLKFGGAKHSAPFPSAIVVFKGNARNRPAVTVDAF